MAKTDFKLDKVLNKLKDETIALKDKSKKVVGKGANIFNRGSSDESTDEEGRLLEE